MVRLVVRLYAELNDFVDAARRQRAFDLTLDARCVRDLLEALAVPADRVDIVLVDGRPAGLDARVADGDRVAVYPVFEAFDVGDARIGAGPPLRAPRFAVGPAHARLAARLRLLGFDVLCGEAFDIGPDNSRSRAGPLDPDARPGGRVLLLGLDDVAPSGATHALRLGAGPPRRQVAELVARLHLEAQLAPGSRCPRCNTPIPRDAAACERCGRPRPRSHRGAKRKSEPPVGGGDREDLPAKGRTPPR